MMYGPVTFGGHTFDVQATRSQRTNASFPWPAPRAPGASPTRSNPVTVCPVGPMMVAVKTKLGYVHVVADRLCSVLWMFTGSPMP